MINFSICKKENSECVRNQSLNILLSLTGNKPYEHEEGANSLATIYAAIQGQLFNVSKNLEIIPSLVESYDIDLDFQIYKLKLRNNLYFHNGRNVTSYDLEFSLLRGFFSTKREFYEAYVEDIEGISEVKAGESYSSGQVTGITIINDLEVAIKLVKPNPVFLHSLITPFLALVPREEFQDDLLTWRKNPIGAGPYKVIESINGATVSLERTTHKNNFANYVNIYTSYAENLNFDILATLPDKFDIQGYDEYLFSLPISTAGLFIVFLNELSCDFNFRKAIYHALDRKNLIDGFSEMTPSYEILPSYFWGRTKLKDPFDLSLAKKFISKVNPDLLKPTIKAMVYGSETISMRTKVILDRLKSQLEIIGINLEFNPTTEKFIPLDKVKNYVFRISGMVCDFSDPRIMFDIFRPNRSLQFLSPLTGDQVVENLYQDSIKSVNLKDRIKAIQNLSEYIEQKVYFIPYAEKRMLFFIKKNKIINCGDQHQNSTLIIENIEIKYDIP